MSGLLDKMKKIEAGWEGETTDASVGEEKAVESSTESQVEKNLEKNNAESGLSTSTKPETKQAPVVEEKSNKPDNSKPKEQSETAAEKKESAQKGKPTKNFKTGGKKGATKKNGGAKKVGQGNQKNRPAAKNTAQNNGKIANADKLQAIVDKTKTKKKGCPKQAKLHQHLNSVGKDGVSHKDRIEKELEEHAKKVKKVIYISCGVILAILLTAIIIFSVIKSNDGKAERKMPDVKKVKAFSYETFEKEMWAYVKNDNFDKAVFHKDFDNFIKQYPDYKGKAENLRARLMRLYGIAK